MINGSPIPRRTIRRVGLSARVSALALALALGTPSVAEAQLNPRGKPVLRTPRAIERVQNAGRAAGATAPAAGAPAAGAAPAAGGAGAGATGGPAPGAGAAGGAAGGAAPQADDPMGNLTQAPKEIEFRPKGGDYMVSFNLDDADLPELVKAISNITGRRFIYGAKLRAIKATVYSPEKVSAAEAYNAFLAILESNGMTVIPHGQFLKIVESQGAAQQTTPVYGTASPVPAEDRFVTRLYRLQSVDAQEVAGVLNNFKTKDGNITVYQPGNLLIITETGSNIRRLLRIIEEIDVGSAGDQIWVQPIHNASASEAATKLNEILGGGGGAAGGRGGRAGGAAGAAGGNIIADDRTNSLIITATKGDYEKILELIKRVVDAPMSGDDQIHVLPLQHAQCDELSGTLNQLLGGGGGRTGTTPRRTGATPPAAAAAAGGGGAATGGGDEIFEGAVKVTCDTATNSLLTTSSLRDYAQLRSVIDRLDQPRRQVFIEAVVMDLNVSRTTDVGVSYHAGAPFDTSEGQGAVYGGNNVPTSVAGIPSVDKLGALALGVRGPEIEGTENIFGTGLSIPGLGVVLHALATDGSSNVLATPHILATDNTPAEISVGQNVPLQTNLGGNIGQLASAAGGAAGALGGLGGLLGGGGFAAPRQDVGTKISVTPHINDSDQVRLDIQEEISEVGSSNGGALGAVSINKRTAKTTLVVRDQQTVVIGGLMRDQETQAETKVPILGDIPLLGFLFRQQVKTKAKTNLLLILTPYVVRDQDDLRAIFERKMQERQEFLDRYFVFTDNQEWTPPQDFSRANGLVESIRQSMLDADERRRLEEEARPTRPRDHQAVEPIAMPTISAPKGAGGTGTATAAATPAAAPAAGAAAGTTRPSSPTTRAATGNTGTPATGTPQRARIRPPQKVE